MGYKSRTHWIVGRCFRECANRGKKCSYCVFFSEYKPVKKEVRNARSKNAKKHSL